MTFAQSEAREMRRRIGRVTGIVLGLLAWAAFWAAMVEQTVSPVWAVVCAVAAGGSLWLWHRAERYPERVLIVEGLSLTLLAAAVYRAEPLAGLLFLAPLILAAILLPLRFVSGLALAALGYLYFAYPEVGARHWLTPAELTGALVLLILPVLAIMWESLNRSWQYSARTLELAEEARQNRGETVRLNRALNLSHSLLERHYEQLAIARYEAEQARHLKQQFATNVSHELRTPLNIILGFLEILQRYPEVYGDVRWTPKLRSDLVEIQQSARYLSDLVDDILDLARIEALKMPLHREPTDPEEVIREAVDLASRLVQNKPVEMTVRVPAPLPRLFIDRTRIRQVLLNLLANASRFTERGCIAVTAELREDQVIVAVADTGPGIPADKLSGLFSEFEQVVSQKGSEKGKGLGLAIAKGFVEMHGGTIWAESQCGRGSTFYFSLPVEPKSVGQFGRAELEKPAERQAAIVVVVDPGGGAGYLRRRLEGCEVVQARDLKEARAVVRERRPDLLVLAVPPDAEGVELGQPPPILPEGVPLVQCTLPLNTWLIEHELFEDWLVKPVGREQLLATIGRFCARGDLLFVDDDPGFIRLMRRTMQTDEDKRYAIRWAYSTEEALARLKERAADLLFVDIALPGRDGRSLAQTLRSDPQTAHLPIIALSASPPWSEATRGRPCTFAITRCGGLEEHELLELLHYTMEQIKPRYAAALPFAESATDRRD